MIVLDTNIVSALMLPQLNRPIIDWHNHQTQGRVCFTTITLVEITFGRTKLPDGKRRRALVRSLRAVEASGVGQQILPLTADAARRAGEARVAAHRATGHGEVPDAMIAGIALAQGASIATRNISHFQHFGVPLINPWQA